MIGQKRRKPVRVAKLLKVTKEGRLVLEVELDCGHTTVKTCLPSENPLKQAYYLCWRCSEELKKGS